MDKLSKFILGGAIIFLSFIAYYVWPTESRMAEFCADEKYEKNVIVSLKKFDLKPHYNYLINYSWPGNVRELRNLVERISILSLNEKTNNINQLVQDCLSQKDSSDNPDSYENVLLYPLKEAREKFEKKYLASQLKKHKGNISKTAEFIGMERSALHRKLKTLGIKGVN